MFRSESDELQEFTDSFLAFGGGPDVVNIQSFPDDGINLLPWIE